MKTLALYLWIGMSTSAFGTSIEVPITFMEALDSKDTTSSERFREDYETAIKRGLEITKHSLEKCGYTLKAETAFYGASDPLQAKERAEKAKQKGAWLIVGPRRSNHYVLATKGSSDLPTVSLMASSDEVSTLGPQHLSLVPTNSVMAEEAAKEATARLKSSKNKSYIVIVRDDCLFCKGFGNEFDKSAKSLGLEKVGALPILGDAPDMKPILDALDRNKPSFILIPNYSIVTSYLIANIQAKRKGLFFVGGDGWGTNFGFVENGRNIEDAKGFTVRGNPPSEIGLTTFPTGKKLLADKTKSTVSSAAALSLLKIIDSTEKFLCSARPRTKDEFARQFQKNGAARYSAPWGVSIYDLSKGSIVYTKSTKAL